MFTPLGRIAAFPQGSSLKSHLGAFKSETYAGGPSPKTAQDDSLVSFASDHELDE
jgi:hypothetical protein